MNKEEITIKSRNEKESLIELFDNVFFDNEEKKIYTKYTTKSSEELREWDPYRSKIAAAILNGLKNFPFKRGCKILYLGVSTGTTCSHISDIISSDGIIYGVDFAERVFYLFLDLAKKRNNIVPIFADARLPNNYFWVEEVDIVYCDIAQPDEIDIAIRNAEIFLKKDGHLIIAIKSRSIDVTKEPEIIYKNEINKLEENGYKILELINLEPYEDSHALVVCIKNKE
ncbi:MAG: fibrillarin-like rRNA/tRNA 2'-O-methyltransferase [Candidatus Aenigmatarchaeota archaeon]